MTFQNYKTADRAQGTLLWSITNVATSLQLQSGEGALSPSTYPYFLTLEEVTLDEFENETIVKYEDVKVTNRSSDTFTIVRAQNGTTAQAFSAGDRVSLYLVSAITTDQNTEIARLETDKLDADGELRTGLWANKVIITNGSGNETEVSLPLDNQQYLNGNGAFATPPLDINGQTAETNPVSADSVAIYDTSAWANRKVTLANLYKWLPNATETTPWLLPEIATEAETLAGTANKFPDAEKIKAVYTWKSVVLSSAITIDDSAQSDIVLAHWLGKTPHSVQVIWCTADPTSSWPVYVWSAWYDGSTITQATSNWYTAVVHYDGDSFDRGNRNVTALDATNVTLSYSFAWSYSGGSWNIYLLVVA